jgi:hypothetical protein
VPKYDAFGREIGEDTLDGLGGTPDAKPRPVTPQREPVAVPPPQPDAAERQALAAQLRGAMEQAAAARATAAPPAGRRSTAQRGCLVAFVLVLVMAGLAVAGGVWLVGSVKTGVSKVGKIRIPKLEPAKPPAAAPAPHGLGARSLVRKANFAAALRRMSGSELRLTHLSLRPDRIDAQLLTRGGRLRSVQVQPGGGLERLGPDSGAGFDSTSTIPFARLRPGAPERLARQGAAKLHVPVSTLQYLVPTLFSGTLTWAAYFKHSRYVIGDAAGRWQRNYP